MKLTLRQKLGFSFAVLIVITTIMLGIFTYSEAKKIVLHEIRFNNEMSLSNVNDYYLKNFMAEMAYVVDTWAHRPEIVNYKNAPGQSKMVRSVPDSFAPTTEAWMGYLTGNPDIAWLYLGVEEDGSLLLAPLDPTMPEDYDCRTRDWYKETIAQDKVYFTQPYLDAGDSGEIIVTVSRAAWNNGKLVGVVGMDIKLSKFSELIKGINASGDGYLMLLGADGEVYAHPDNKMLTQNVSQYPWVARILSTSNGTDFFTESGVSYIYSYLTVPDTGWKLVGVRPVNIPAAVSKIRSWTIDAAVVALTCMLLASVALTNVLLKPLGTMMSTITQVSSGDMENRMAITTGDEFGVIGDSFNHMLDRINVLVRERETNVEKLTQLLHGVREGYITTVRALANAIEASDTYTRGHCDRVRKYAVKVGEALNLDEQEMSNLEFASMLHDIGKIGVSNAILNKPGILTVEEFEEIQRHPTIGAEIIAGIPFLEECQIILKQHHERMDGKGYPHGLSGNAIHRTARILAVVDAYDAMTSVRPYRMEPMGSEHALEELEKGKGNQFDPELVTIFAGLIRNKSINWE